VSNEQTETKTPEQIARLRTHTLTCARELARKFAAGEITKAQMEADRVNVFDLMRQVNKLEGKTV
jgi:hypothetical protein